MRRKARRRKNTGALIAVLAFLGIIAGIVCQRMFVVRNVVIDGNVQASQEEIVRAARVEFGGSISRVNEDLIRSNLESSGKYALDGVSVKYPNTVILAVRERTKDAVVINGGQYLVLDSDGYVVEVLPVMPESGGIYVYGLNATSYRLGSRIVAPDDRLANMKIVLDAARQQYALEYISDVDISSSEDIKITTRTGIIVRMGDTKNMENKMLWLRSAVSDLEARGEIRGTLDISSGDRADFRP